MGFPPSFSGLSGAGGTGGAGGVGGTGGVVVTLVKVTVLASTRAVPQTGQLMASTASERKRFLVRVRRGQLGLEQT